MIYYFFLLYSSFFPPLAVSESAVPVSCPAVTLYYSPNCPYSREVVWHLDEMNKQITLINVIQNPDAKNELVKVGGRLEVPCLVVNGQAIYNSKMIINWLDSHRDELENKPASQEAALVPRSDLTISWAY